MLKNYSIIKISGPDAVQFLQGQLSNDVTKLSDTQCDKQWQFSCYCNQKGRVIAFLWLALIDSAFYLCLPTSAIELTLADLKKFGAFSKVEIKLETNLKLAAIFDKTVGNFHEQVLICMDHAGNKPFSLCIIEELNLKPEDDNKWELTNIINQLPIISQVQQEKFTPHQLNLQHTSALAFKKGCYRGQEIIARMEYLGKLKQQLYYVEIKGDTKLEPISAIITTEAKTLGEIVNITATEPNHYQALAVLNKAAIETANSGIIHLEDGQTLRIIDLKIIEKSH